MSESNAGRIGVFGRSGSGKSSYVKQLIEQRSRVVVFDALDEYAAIKGFARVSNIDDVRLQMRKSFNAFKIAYVPHAGSESTALSDLSFLLCAAQKYYKEGKYDKQMTLVVEEMNLSFHVSNGEHKARGFAEICSRGRHFGIEVIGVSQRIAEVSTRFRGNTTECVILAQRGPRDVQAACDAIGAKPDEVKSLQTLDYMHEKNGIITRSKLTFKNTQKK